MKITLDLKSAAIGLAIGIAAISVIGAAAPPCEGRYHVTVGGNPPIVVEVDSVTGQIWMGNGMANQLKSDGNIYQPKLN